MNEVTRGTFLRAKQEVTVAIDLLHWLTSHDIKLHWLRRSHWTFAKQKDQTTRKIAERFLMGDQNKKPPHPG
ncbi:MULTISPECIES: hypothetical protein [unclassified Pseudarthrobacter]|uniref:hypothetical protein n=1 Tax=unclassified Pseudarthrobacter TaxID=2647000 RepID=UPI003077DD73